MTRKMSGLSVLSGQVCDVPCHLTLLQYDTVPSFHDYDFSPCVIVMLNCSHVSVVDETLRRHMLILAWLTGKSAMDAGITSTNLEACPARQNNFILVRLDIHALL
jgi:hypothetical protein